MKRSSWLIGTVSSVPAHVEAARRLGFVDMIALCEANATLWPARRPHRSHIPNAYGRRGCLPRQLGIDVVHNWHANHVHFAISKKIMAAGKH